ncbi:MAG: beta-propeller fold lactonase family protein [Patescibacteria group bacterium]|nr:beta-propeller fold lactonase family protein [Patescibacteria group bacterium]
MENTKSPKIKQVIHCGNRPRGITFTPEGTVLVAGFYSRKLHFLKENRGKYQKSSKLVRFASKAYSGNMRDVLVTKNGKYAYVSNMGKNMVHKFDLEKKTFTKSTLVGKFPSSIRFLNNKENALLVSCRESNFIYFLDTKRMKIIGHSEKTSKKPTGLAPVPRGFLCTAFRSNTLEYHKISTNILV